MEYDAEINKKKKELEELKKKAFEDKLKREIRESNDYTVQEKLEWFDETHRMAKKELMEHLENSYDDDDNEHYAWEHYIEILGKKVWNIWNKRGD